MLYVGPRRGGRPGPNGPWPPFVFSRGCLSRGSGGGGQPKSLGSGFTSAPHRQGGEAVEGAVGARSPGGIGGKWTNAPGRCRGNHAISNKPGFFLPFSKNSRLKKLKVKKNQGHFSAKNLAFRRFLGLQPKNSKEKLYIGRYLFGLMPLMSFYGHVCGFLQYIRTFVCLLVLFRVQIRVCKKYTVHC